LWEKKSNRIFEILFIVVIGAIVSLLNTLWLRKSLLEEIGVIAKNVETNIVNEKVVNISDKMRSNQ
jgi:hypothetical protein